MCSSYIGIPATNHWLDMVDVKMLHKYVHIQVPHMPLYWNTSYPLGIPTTSFLVYCQNAKYVQVPKQKERYSCPGFNVEEKMLAHQ